MFNSFFEKLRQEYQNQSFKDPVCRMRVSNEMTVVYQGTAYAFCSDSCKQQFGKDPESYVKK